MSLVKNTILVALGGLGAVVAIDHLAKPAKTHGIANAMRTQLDEYNTNVKAVQDRKYVCPLCSMPILSFSLFLRLDSWQGKGKDEG
jgi:hypothetical protein